VVDISVIQVVRDLDLCHVGASRGGGRTLGRGQVGVTLGSFIQNSYTCNSTGHEGSITQASQELTV